MDARISPSYSHEKVENPSFLDLVDVFEDLWRNYIFSPVWLLLNSPHGDIAAMTILCSYFETIQSYMSGEDSNHRSKEFFIKGFCQVFHSESAGIEDAATAIYKHIRCGLAHEGMMTHKVNYSRAGAKAFFLTYPKNPNGSLNTHAGIASIILNPLRVYQGVEQHFKIYLGKLRTAEDMGLCQAFRQTAERLWAVGTGENIVGMSEAEYLGCA
ncbi:hypothetical protein [Methylocaldum sp.]|uniref:hypothetical protein n=1 Tax=Methylocaldum sp. TaxID=1969727 RepID=UPI002D250AE4|nr:hypothetical protein [Methylocaldum sp.]HYE35301.1 hypothetical protein [Methylocaldum sp.]